MKLIRLALTFVFAGVLFASCEEEKEPIDVSKRAYLHGRAWNMIEYFSTMDADAEVPVYVDVLDGMSVCTYDDFMFFTTKSEGIYSDYFVRCDIMLPEQYPIYLDISADDNIISVYTNPDDVSGSLILYGTMSTPHIDTFTVEHRFWDETTETFHMNKKKFVVTNPTDI